MSRTNRFTFLRWIGVVQEDLARLPSAARQRYVAFLGLLAYDRLGLASISRCRRVRANNRVQGAWWN